MIELKSITKKYDDALILDDISYSLPDTGLVCLLGASGCGKSTLLNMLAGFDSDYQGEIIIANTSITEMNSTRLCEYRRDNVGFIFQNYNLLTGYTVLENVLLQNDYGTSNPSALQTAQELLARLSLLEKQNERVENLSGGQKQRVAIARALICNPSLVLADEPTGSLDRKNATEIMALLKEISQTRLVLVITHDQKICEYADHIISISEGKLIATEPITSTPSTKSLKQAISQKASAFKLGCKNFKIHLLRFLSVSLAISIGIVAFVLSLSSRNIMDQSIADFKQKNTAFNNGYIKLDSTADPMDILTADQRLENIYYQYKLSNLTLTIDDSEIAIEEKFPVSKSTESMSYGVMPRMNQSEIALSPSLAKKMSTTINKLIGQSITLTYNDQDYVLTISGIFNAGYDEFFISSDIEQRLYQNLPTSDAYSVSYDVISFEDIVAVDSELIQKGYISKTVSQQVSSMQTTFGNISKLFYIVSILILIISLFICVILLSKLQSSRYKEIGLLSALGFSKKTIRTIIISENLLLCIQAAIINAVIIALTYAVCTITNIGLIITIPQILLSILGTAIALILISIVTSHKLIHTEPAIALRK